MAGSRDIRGTSWRCIPRLTAIFAVLLGAGCADGRAVSGVPGDGYRPLAGLTWAGYLYGEDLRASCREGGPDRYRLIVNAPGPGASAQVLEMTGRPQSGGTLSLRELPVSRVDQLGAGEPAPPIAGLPGHTTQVTPEQFDRVAQHLAQGGVFLPPASRLDLQAGSLRWFATGCFDGLYFLSARAGGPALRLDA